MNSSEWIPIGDLPQNTGGFSRLFSDYVAGSPGIKKYFEHDLRSWRQIGGFARHTAGRFPHRQVLVDVLTEQNRSFGAPATTFENISLLADPRTVAIVTGQQVGMLGGPLYTFYKAATAIRLAKELSALEPDINFVPVFWLEGEDHDFEEINHVQVLNSEGAPAAVHYLIDGKLPTKNPGPVGEMVPGPDLAPFFESLAAALPGSEFKQPLLDMLRKHYTPDATMNQAFASLLGSLFADDGLIFISVNDKRLKALVAPVFEKEIREYPSVSQLIIRQSADLEGHYHAQIKTKALNLFYFFKGGRYFIEPRENDFSLKGTRHFIARDELLRIALESPECLSPNVALRPILQDTVLPTAAYVAGPSEIAYFAQLRPVYEHFSMTMPLIFPRATATLMEERIQKILDKFGLGPATLLTNPDQLHRRIADLVSEVKIDDMFGVALQRLNDQIGEMKFGLNYIDPTLMGALETTRTRMEASLLSLKEKAAAAQQRRYEASLRQFDKAMNALFPNRNFQERELSLVHFMNKHGQELPSRIREALVIGDFRHQIIPI